MHRVLSDIVSRNRAGQAVAIPSICTAHEDVLRIALSYAQKLNAPIVVEATSNQVNQDGGYTGLTPASFVASLSKLRELSNMDQSDIVLGGDHLGPQAWRNLPAKQAMEKASVMIEDYVRAGFSKIHLDCSEGCAGEPDQLDDAVTAARSAKLMQAALQASKAPNELTFVIGTEVPPPGGARLNAHDDINATLPEAAKATLEAHALAFRDLGLTDVITQVSGLVVQPGVEFSPMQVHDLPSRRDPGLRNVMMNWPNLCLEAHSTDYQSPDVYPHLAELGFAYQKVGPALTYAWRRAVYALGQIVAFISVKPANLPPVMERLMLENPEYWISHYSGDDPSCFVQRHFGLADRIRYYWPQEAARDAVQTLMQQSSLQSLSEPLLDQFFAPDVVKRANEAGRFTGQSLIDASVEVALEPYFFGFGRTEIAKMEAEA